MIANKTKKILIIFSFAIFGAISFFLKKEIVFQKFNKIFENNNEIKIGLISDIHHCYGQKIELQPFITKTEQEKTDLNISLGDNANMRVGNCSASYKTDFQYVVDNLKTKSPLYFVIGDHDIGDTDSFSYWKEKTKNEKSYFSFDNKNFHFIILDTILGGEEMSFPCNEVAECVEKENRYLELKELKKDSVKRDKFLVSNGWDYEKFKQELLDSENAFNQIRDEIKNTRSSGRRDIGRISQKELDWIKDDLLKTPMEKIIILSDHPLFHFISERKEYNIVNGDKLREILKSSRKQIVCISGEAHLWHEENIEGIQYYIVSRYADPDKSFGILNWDQKGYQMEKISF